MNTFDTLSTFSFESSNYAFHSFSKLEKKFGTRLKTLPYSFLILLENLLRHEDGKNIKSSDIEALIGWDPQADNNSEVPFIPSRVLLQDFTGVPVVADLTAMRNEVVRRGGDPRKVNPIQPVDLVIDHSVQVDSYGHPGALQINAELEFERNKERYELLKWAQKKFSNFRVVPPATGICHQVNLEHLSPLVGVWKSNNRDWIFPDTVVGTDSHTPMINGLGVLGWGVGGIEAEAAMLGQAFSILIPKVLGVHLTGNLRSGVTATDMVLTITQKLRALGVVGQFVEYFGPGVLGLSVADRATVSNMTPEYGSTIGLFPVDQMTLNYMIQTGRDYEARRAAAYFREQGWMFDVRQEKRYSSVLEINLSDIEPSVAGPSRPHDRYALSSIRESWSRFISGSEKESKKTEFVPALIQNQVDQNLNLKSGSVLIAAITSCTNTSNPHLMMGAALLARNASKRGLQVKPWVKTSFAPGSPVVTEYLRAAGLMKELEKLNFHLVGYGCTTCIGNSGPLSAAITEAIEKKGLIGTAVLSGNRNFEARINPLIAGNYLMSPPLVVAFSLAGHIDFNMEQDPLGLDNEGKAVYLKDIWPDFEEVNRFVDRFVVREKFKRVYEDIWSGPDVWKNIKVSDELIYPWNLESSYIQEPPFPAMSAVPGDIKNARILVWLGDFVTTDHISPAGGFSEASEAGKYLRSLGVEKQDFNSYGARRGNHHVMLRGTLANVRLQNKLVANKAGAWTVHWPSKDVVSIYEAAQRYSNEKTDLVIIAGKEYGSGSSRDWAAKGVRLLGVRAVLAESYERIHRSNLVGMGVLPLQFLNGESARTLQLTGDEKIDIKDLEKITPRSKVKVIATERSGESKTFEMIVRIDTPNEIKYFHSGGVLPYVLQTLI